MSIAGAGLAVLAAGCASASGASSSTAAQSAAPGTAVGTQAATCAASGVKVTQGSPSGAAAGSRYLTLDFTNTSSHSCTLSGYPAVAQTTSTSPASQVGAAATHAATKPVANVTLAPGATASSTLQVTEAANYPASSCQGKQASYLKVTPPGGKTATYLPYKSEGCVKPAFVLGIAAVQPGSHG